MESKQCDASHFERIVYFLMDLVQKVKEHIRSYLPDILKAMEPFWETKQEQILLFVRTCSSCFHSEFKLYLVYVLPRMLSILGDETTERKTATEIVHCLLCIVPSLDNHLNVVLPCLLRFIENTQKCSLFQLEGVKCLRRIVHELDVSLYISQIIMPLLRLLSCDMCDVVPEIMDVICAIVCQKQQESYIYLSAINKVVGEKNIVYPKFNEISNALYRGGILPTMEYVFDKDDDSVILQDAVYPARPYHCDTTALQGLWRQATSLSTKEDWKEWNRRFALHLIKESPDPSLRSCHALAQAINPFASELFNAAFTSMWNELSPANRADLVSCFKQAFESPQVPPEIVMQLLSLGEFMEHDEDVVLQMSKDYVLPLDIRILGNLAISSNAYAKALHYKEMEYETTPDTCIEKLIQINNQLHLSDAAVGVLRYSQKYHGDVTEVKDELYEKLGRWEEALEAYERKQLNLPLQTELTMGRIRCLSALGESEMVLRVIKLAEDKLEDSGQGEVVASYAAKAAYDLGDWSDLEHYVNKTASSSPAIIFYQAALLIHQGQFDQAEKLIAETRLMIGRTLAPIVSEGYTRVYSHFIQLEKLEELEEICRLQRLKEQNSPLYEPSVAHLIVTFDRRLEGVQYDVTVWHDLLSLRKLFVQIGDKDADGVAFSRKHWLKFISLARKSDRPALALRTLSSLGINLKGATVLGENMDDELGAAPEVRYAYHKFLYYQGLTKNAITRLRRLVEETKETPLVTDPRSSELSIPSLHGGVMEPDEANVQIKIRTRLRLAHWELDENHRNLTDEVVQDISTIIRECSSINKDDHKAFHEIAMLHMACAEYYHTHGSAETPTTPGSPTVPSTASIASIASTASSTCVVAGGKGAVRSDMTLESSKNSDLITQHLREAIGNFFDAISLSKDRNSSIVLQDILRIITLWFTYGGREEVINEINRGFNIISLDTWLYVIPQLVARIHIDESKAKRLLINLLVQLSKAHPQALVYSLTRSARSSAESRKKAALEVLSHLRRDNIMLVKEADIVSGEMIRVAVLWTERWMRGIEDASCQYYDMKNIKKMLSIFDDLYRMIGSPSEVQLR